MSSLGSATLTEDVFFFRKVDQNPKCSNDEKFDLLEKYFYTNRKRELSENIIKCHVYYFIREQIISEFLSEDLLDDALFESHDLTKECSSSSIFDLKPLNKHQNMDSKAKDTSKGGGHLITFSIFHFDYLTNDLNIGKKLCSFRDLWNRFSPHLKVDQLH
jgi:hypothetical protein